MNKGYVGYQRSVRSQVAIESFEMPLSMIKKDVIQDFIRQNDDYESLKNLPVLLWKYVAKQIGSDSWHHTSSYYNKTDHYSLFSIADYLLEHDIDEIKASYKADKEAQKAEKDQELKDIELAVATVQQWGGSRRHPHLMGTQQVLGVKKGDWLYTVSDSDQDRYNLYARKVESFDIFRLTDYHSKLIKQYPEFKSMKRQINRMVKYLTSK